MAVLEIDRALIGYKVEETRPVTGETKINIDYIQEPGCPEVKMTTKRTMNWRHSRMDVAVSLESTDRVTEADEEAATIIRLVANPDEEAALTGAHRKLSKLIRNSPKAKGFWFDKRHHIAENIVDISRRARE